MSSFYWRMTIQCRRPRLADTCGKRRRRGKRYRQSGKRDWPKGLKRDLGDKLEHRQDEGMDAVCFPFERQNVYFRLYLTRRYEVEYSYSKEIFIRKGGGSIFTSISGLPLMKPLNQAHIVSCIIPTPSPTCATINAPHTLLHQCKHSFNIRDATRIPVPRYQLTRSIMQQGSVGTLTV